MRILIVNATQKKDNTMIVNMIEGMPIVKEAVHKTRLKEQIDTSHHRGSVILE